MNHCTDMLAFQGSGMVSQPSSLAVKHRIKDSQLRAVEYRMVEILSEGGFDHKETFAIANAVSACLRERGSVSESDLTGRLEENGFSHRQASVIASNIISAI